jgi:hypothetical protein
MSEYPVMKTPVPVGKVLNFNNGDRKYKVVASEGISYGDKGFLLNCICIQSSNSSMIGKEYDFDDRAFRDYSDNNIVIEDLIESKGSLVKVLKISQRLKPTDDLEMALAMQTHTPGFISAHVFSSAANKETPDTITSIFECEVFTNMPSGTRVAWITQAELNKVKLSREIKNPS